MPTTDNFIHRNNTLNLTGATRGVMVLMMVDDVLEAVYRNASNVDVSLTKISRSEYQALSNKGSTGQPTQYYVQRFIDRITITLYLTPGTSENGKFLNFLLCKKNTRCRWIH